MSGLSIACLLMVVVLFVLVFFFGVTLRGRNDDHDREPIHINPSDISRLGRNRSVHFLTHRRTYKVSLPSYEKALAVSQEMKRRGKDMLDEHCTPMVVSERYRFIWLRNVGKNGGTAIYGAYLQPSLCSLYMRNVLLSLPLLMRIHHFLLN